MKTPTKTWLIIAIFLVLIGGILWAGVMTVLKWDFTKLSTMQYETNQHEITETIRNISVDTETAKITFALSDGNTCRVECYEETKAKHSVSVQDGILVIQVNNNKAWYDYIGINFASPKIIIYLPTAEYAALTIRNDTGDIKLPGDLVFTSIDISLSTGDVHVAASASETMKIQTSTGSICVEDSSVGALDLATSTGDITVSRVTCQADAKLAVSTGKTVLKDVTCKNLTSKGNTGDITLSNVIASENFSVIRTTGDVTFNRADAAEIFVETDTGKVTGSLLTEKVFIAHTSTGKVDVPTTTTGGRCEITTSTGNIRITIQ